MSPQIRNQIELSIAGDYAKAAAIHHELMPLINMLFVESNPIPVKYACEVAGLVAGPTRLPLTSLSSVARDRLDLELTKHELTLG